LLSTQPYGLKLVVDFCGVARSGETAAGIAQRSRLQKSATALQRPSWDLFSTFPWDVCRAATLETIRQIGPPVTMVKGNNDFFQPWPMEELLERHGVTCRLIHIPPRPTKLGTTHLLLHGHTHVPRDEVVEGVRILNPGSIGKANKGAPPSYAWLHLGTDQQVEWRIVRV